MGVRVGGTIRGSRERGGAESVSGICGRQMSSPVLPRPSGGGGPRLQTQFSSGQM